MRPAAPTISTCPECSGTRLNAAARSSKIRKLDIAEARAMQILAAWVRELDDASVAPLVTTLPHTLDSFVGIGLGFRHLGSSLSFRFGTGVPERRLSDGYC